MTPNEAFSEICGYLLGKDFYIIDPVDSDTARDILVKEIKNRYAAKDISRLTNWRSCV